MTANLTTTTAAVLCRCCNQPMDAKSQEALVPGRPIVLVTCDQPSCVMHNYTFDSRDYDDVDLSEYCPEPHVFQIGAKVRVKRTVKPMDDSPDSVLGFVIRKRLVCEVIGHGSDGTVAIAYPDPFAEWDYLGADDLESAQ